MGGVRLNQKGYEGVEKNLSLRRAKTNDNLGCYIDFLDGL